jgi:hypothetical protein
MATTPENVYLPSGDLDISVGDRPYYLNDLTRQYHGTYVLIATEGPLSGQARNCRLDHIGYVVDGITFHLECDTDSETRFVVANPERMILHRDTSGVTECLELISLDGSVTRVWFGDAVDRMKLRDQAA